MSLREQILQLEFNSKLLEPDLPQIKNWDQQVFEYAHQFIDRIYEIPAYVASEDKGKNLYDFPLGEAKSLEQLLDIIKNNVDTPGLNPASGGHLGYIPGGGIYPSALGDYLAAVFNRYAGMFFGSPGAVRMENQLINWVRDVMGYPLQTKGNLCSGGSIANLIAICTARDSKNIDPKNFHKQVIYTTSQVHHCIHKAIHTSGLSSVQKHVIPMDDFFRMDADYLERQIQEDVQNGLIPFIVIASAGTTDTGAVDPLDRIADICSQNQIWFHVDAAYGGFFNLLEEKKPLFKGIERSDSLVIDPHKGLFLPYGTGVVLVREGSNLFKSQHMAASYLQDAYIDAEEVSPADLSPELTKHFRGLRMWLPLQLFGITPFEYALREKLLLAQYFADQIRNLGFELANEPQLSVMAYRYIPKNQIDPNYFNSKLIEYIQKDGQVFLSSTQINGTYYLRMAILSFRTHLKTIDTCLEKLAEAVAHLEKTL